MTKAPDSTTAQLDQSLTRLRTAAARDTGQANRIKRFLLSLYNGYRFRFDLTELRGLDDELVEACLLVLREDALYTRQEVHMYFPDGQALFERWARELGMRDDEREEQLLREKGVWEDLQRLYR